MCVGGGGAGGGADCLDCMLDPLLHLIRGIRAEVQTLEKKEITGPFHATH